jgi:two-component system torCAD operon response regulator TorR
VQLIAKTKGEARLLVVEDDSIVRRVVVASLEAQGFLVAEATDAAMACSRFTQAPFDLAIVDIGLPGENGFALVSRLRAIRDVAVIFMTSLGSPEARIRGLEAGDDYLVKPVDLGELAARVRAVLRRFRRPAASEVADARVPIIEFDGWTLDLVRRELADPASGLMRLTRAEFDLLAALVQAGGNVLAREYLLEVVSSADSETLPRTIDVMISRIRKKLARAAGPTPQILTIKGAGYRFERAVG